MRRRTLSMRTRLLALLLGGMVLVWGGAALLTWRDAAHELDELLDAHLAQTAALLLARQAHLDHDDDDDRPLRTESLHRYAPRVAVQVFHDGRLVLRTPNVGRTPLASPRRAGFQDVATTDARWRVFVARGDDDRVVIVGEQTASRMDILRAVLRSVLWPLLFALPLLGAAAAWAVHRGLAPLGALRDVLARRAPDDTGPLALPAAPVELEAPLEALDNLLARVERLLTSERRFTADAAHELRTPIAALRAQADAAIGARDAAERDAALEAVRTGTVRATRLVEQMLTLSRLDAGARLVLAPVDVAALARTVLADLAPAALARDQDISLDDAAAPPMHADDTVLALLLRNLVDNAIRHAPPGARIEVAIGPGADGGGCLRIADSGPGLPADALAHLGERFWRAAPGESEGSGLGWSIVRRCAEALSLEIDVGRSAELGGLEVELRWQAAGGRV
jgi:two-component system sensor histidine kinase QseC